MMAERNFLGTGWAYPVNKDSDGHILMALAEDSIRQSIVSILNTRRGERVMRPDFGCEIHELVFAANSASTRGLIERAVRDALLLWEPRIEIDEVLALPDQQERNKILVTIAYTVSTTNSRDNLVYPFYLE